MDVRRHQRDRPASHHGPVHGARTARRYGGGAGVVLHLLHALLRARDGSWPALAALSSRPGGARPGAGVAEHVGGIRAQPAGRRHAGRHIRGHDVHCGFARPELLGGDHA